MKRHGILNADLNAAVSRLGHGDQVLLADCGMPAPSGVPVIDLALVHGIPRFEEVLAALLQDLVFESAIVASELRGTEAETWIDKHFAPLSYVSHAELKALSGSAKLFIRTGEATPYANALLSCGVSF
ncbi:D-ribose pyranase [Pseudarthrobacter sp. J75]|uniref:D-ribose pyranase n=1 Tax=unclassified Pseudarthrobacter TaxID=2647000 RepID=UPI002E7FD6DE|nr:MULTISPECIES: D-ribose pyranase [unclassified Pseudarthrobacter]MEE2524582.1 D-ribose pyranase [Pseudarthrobacter sp. J47]MEE2527589.1 D-ribose pyranase [Pseudarthrobacter sp. J75]